MNTKRAVIGLLLCGCLFQAFRCTHAPTAGNGSQTPNASVMAMLYNQDGSPAVGVQVFIRPMNTLADTALGIGKRMADTASAVTDTNGRYTFDTTLNTGTYVIEAASGNNAVLIDSVAVTSKDSTDSLAPDTLKPAGAIKGVIWLSEGEDPRKVFVLVFGIDRFARVNADGSFRFAGLAEGKYDLRLISSLDDYGVLDTSGVRVTTGDTTDLDTIRLPFTGIPTPINLTVTYDTLANAAILHWNIADTGVAKGYNVYRRTDSTGQFTMVNTVLVTDTLYVDNPATELEKGRTYQYYVNAVDANNNAGPNSVAISVVIAYYVDAGKDTVVTIGDSVTITGRINTAAVSAIEYRWDVNGDGTDEFVSAVSAAVRFAYADTGRFKAVFAVKGGNNSVYRDTVRITVAQKDTAGAPSEPRNVKLTYDTLKQIVTIMWSPNLESDVRGYNVYRRNVDSNTILTRVNNTIVAIATYVDNTLSNNATYEYVVAALDYQNNEGHKSPVASVTFQNRFKLATDSTEFSPSSPQTALVFNNKMWIIIGGILNKLWSSNDGFKWTKVADSTAFSGRQYQASVAFNNEMWVIGGKDSNVFQDDVWHSNDGINWVLATDSAGFRGRMGHAAIVYDNNIWVIGGYDGVSEQNDVWKSNDGINWEKVIENASFSARAGLTANVFNNELILLGGSGAPIGSGYSNDIWSSTDGITWTEISANGGFPGVYGPAATVFQNQIWLVSGENINGYSDDVWASSDGKVWIKFNTPANFTAKNKPSAVVFNNSLWVIGLAMKSNQSLNKTDVWYLH